MAKVSPFHTDSEEYPMAHREVYHDNDACYEGKKIFPEHRQGGTGGKPLCDVCAGLSKQGSLHILNLPIGTVWFTRVQERARCAAGLGCERL